MFDASTPEKRAEIAAIFNECRTQYGAAGQAALDVLTSGFVIAEHAGQHCASLEDQVAMLTAICLRGFKAAGLTEAALEGVSGYGERVMKVLASPAAAPRKDLH